MNVYRNNQMCVCVGGAIDKILGTKVPTSIVIPVFFYIIDTFSVPMRKTGYK